MAVFFEINEARSILGLGDAASEAEIEAAYQNMSLECHPDRHKLEASGEADRKMKDGELGVHSSEGVLLSERMHVPIHRAGRSASLST